MRGVNPCGGVRGTGTGSELEASEVKQKKSSPTDKVESEAGPVPLWGSS